eukprot:85296_1
MRIIASLLVTLWLICTLNAVHVAPYTDTAVNDYGYGSDEYGKGGGGQCEAYGFSVGKYCQCRQSCAGKDCQAGQTQTGNGFGGGKFCETGVCCCGTDCDKPSFGDGGEGNMGKGKGGDDGDTGYTKKGGEGDTDYSPRSSVWAGEEPKGECEAYGFSTGKYCKCRQSCAGKDCQAGKTETDNGFGGGKYCETGVCCCGTDCDKPSFGQGGEGNMGKGGQADAVAYGGNYDNGYSSSDGYGRYGQVSSSTYRRRRRRRRAAR